MNKRTFALVQHKLIPIALIAGNIAFIHLIYLLSKADYSYALVLAALCLAVLVSGILRANKYILLAGVVAYTLLLFFSCMV